MIEILVALVVISILASTAIVNYQGYVDRAAMLQDETNLMVLQTAVKINAMDAGVVAGNISDLPQRDVEKAYAAVIEGKRPYTLLAYLQEKWQSAWGDSVAEGGTFAAYYNRDLKTVTCPKDTVRPSLNTNGDVVNPSYVISKAMRGKTVQVMLANPDSTLLYEVKKTTAGGGGTDANETEAYRHAGGLQTVRVQVSGRTTRRKSGDTSGDDHPDQLTTGSTTPHP